MSPLHPQFFCAITSNLAASGLAQRLEAGEKTWHRIVYEKPFGHDLASAQHIDRCIEKSFFEQQIYGLYNFLSKELVSNIALLRFTNIFFEPIWNNHYIDNIQIILDEKIGIDGRGAYYDKSGALADVMQNHMLEMLALIAMESPSTLTGDDIRTARATLLAQVNFADGIVGQYDTYRAEPAVAADSKTETFAAVIVTINNERWRGVPFYLKTGKKMSAKQTSITITFKKVDLLTRKTMSHTSQFLNDTNCAATIFCTASKRKKNGYLVRS